jgi:ferrous iron transport protein A
VAARITAVGLEGLQVDWLRALGLFEGQTVRVLRRGLFGGPLHLRTGSGGEMAVDRSVARLIQVTLEPTGAST